MCRWASEAEQHLPCEPAAGAGAAEADPGAAGGNQRGLQARDSAPEGHPLQRHQHVVRYLPFKSRSPKEYLSGGVNALKKCSTWLSSAM